MESQAEQKDAEVKNMNPFRVQNEQNLFVYAFHFQYANIVIHDKRNNAIYRMIHSK